MHKNKRDIAKIGLWAALTLFIISAFIIFVLPGIDTSVSNYFISKQTLNGLKIMQTISDLVSVPFVLIVSLIILFWFIFQHERKEFYFYLSCVAIGPLIAPVLKQIFQRARPSTIFDTGYSFPSGHATASVAFFGALAFMAWPKYKKTSIALMLMPLIVGLSRLYLNVHWFSDVLAGFGFGLALVSANVLFWHRKLDKNKVRK